MKASGIKVLTIDGIAATQSTVRDKSWPYARPTFYYTNGDPTGLAKDFVDFTIGPAGQKIVDAVGFVPIK
jgi:phosphate transport system substrate-binding protein